MNLVVEAYSRLADQYDDEANVRSCWGRASEKIVSLLVLKDRYKNVLDIGCGTGTALVQLAKKANENVQFVGIDPAENMRRRAAERTRGFPQIKILDGCFEIIPLEIQSVDYFFSIFAFHWTTDLQASLREMARVLAPRGEMDLFFTGRYNGREFTSKTTPIFLGYMGVAGVLNSAKLRKQLTRDETLRLFSTAFQPNHIEVEESYDTYYDTLEGHWGWWVRVEGHFAALSSEKREECYQKVREALATLAGEKGIPYTIHQIHVKLRTG